MEKTIEARVAQQVIDLLFRSRLTVFPINGIALICFSSPDNVFVFWAERLRRIVERMDLWRTVEAPTARVGVMGQSTLYAGATSFAPLGTTLPPSGKRFLKIRVKGPELLRGREKIGEAHQARRARRNRGVVLEMYPFERRLSARLPRALGSEERDRMRAYVLRDVLEFFSLDEGEEFQAGFALWVVEPRYGKERSSVVARLLPFVEKLSERTGRRYEPWPADPDRQLLVRYFGSMQMATLRYGEPR